MRLRFTDAETLAVHITGASNARRMDFREAGFADGRKGRPNKQWDVLIEFALNGGMILPGQRHPFKVRTFHVHRLGAALRALFHTEQKPFEYLNAQRGWRARFRVEPWT